MIVAATIEIDHRGPRSQQQRRGDDWLVVQALSEGTPATRAPQHQISPVPTSAHDVASLIATSRTSETPGISVGGVDGPATPVPAWPQPFPPQ